MDRPSITILGLLPSLAHSGAMVHPYGPHTVLTQQNHQQREPTSCHFVSGRL